MIWSLVLLLPTEAFLSAKRVSQISSLQSLPSQNTKTFTIHLRKSTPFVVKDHLPSSRGQKESKKNFFATKKHFKLRVAMGITLTLLLLPLKAYASTSTGPVIDSIEGFASATAIPTVLTAAPPVSADVELRLTMRLIYAAILGAGLGKERSHAKHSAGVRTMALVAMGASAFTVCSAFGFSPFGRYDPSRMASNVASGVGFVGAGVITTTHLSGKNVVHGLTTAATIWLSAAVGVACGTGLHRIATAAALTTVCILRMGRAKPKVKEAVKSDQVEVPSLTNKVVHGDLAIEEVEEEEEEDQDHYAEIHDTSVWDEHPDTLQGLIDEKSIEVNPQIEDVEQKLVSEAIAVEEDHDMEDMVIKAWSNSTNQEILYSKNLEEFTTANRSSYYVP